MRLIVTRPQAQAAAWVDALRALGCDAQALPLMEIESLSATEPVRQAWHRVLTEGHALLMFVSANAVGQFFAGVQAQLSWPCGTLAGSTGPGTTAALRRAGVPEAAIVEPRIDNGRFDSEALWERLEHLDWRDRRVLVVRGEGGRDWLADTLRRRGAIVDFVATYRRLPPSLDGTGKALLQQALADAPSHLWLLSSSEAVGHLRGLAPGAGWSRSRAVAYHPRIAAAARAIGFVQVVHSLPSPAAVAQVAAGWTCGVSKGPSIQSEAL